MSYHAAEEACTETELKRIACCFLTGGGSMEKVDWAAAASQFSPDQKPSSFKARVMESMRKIEKRLTEGINGGVKVDGKDLSPVKKKQILDKPKATTTPQTKVAHKVTKRASKAKGKVAGKGNSKRKQADDANDEEDLTPKDEDAMDE